MTPPRRSLTPAQKAKVIKRQQGYCGCKCGEELGTDPREIEFHHMHGLWCDGGNELDNFAALKKKHHLAITKKEAGDRAKMERIAKRDGLRLRKPNAKDRALAKMLERN